ncbi:MAG: class I SAM-dependent methyltransferase [Gammaproteobacteria bacterium]
MGRGYQFGYSARETGVFNVAGRERKAKTIVAVLEDYFKKPLTDLDLLDVGASTGIIDNYLSCFFQHVTGVDIDEKAVKFAVSSHCRENLKFCIADAMTLPFKNDSFDVVVCAHVYEHLPDPSKMLDEIFRVLKPQGVCYFSAGNRLMWNEPHYNLPLLSVLPRPFAHLYLRLSGRGEYYYEKHLTYWGLKSLVGNRTVCDYTPALIRDPRKFRIEYMLDPGSLKGRAAEFILTYLKWLSPGYIWVILKK